MSQDIVAKPIDAPALQPLPLPKRLADTPTSPPQFPASVKNTCGKEVTLGDPMATRALVALMNVHAVNGGAACHWGGPAAFAEIMSAVHGLMFADSPQPWYESFNFINDAGHAENGIYALRANYRYGGLTLDDLKKFRSLGSNLTGHGESHLYPEGVLLSNGPLGSACPQSQGLAMADKIAKRNRVTICIISDGAMMEGEAKESVAAIPGLAAKGQLNPYVLILSDNNTKLSGRISKDAFDMQPSFQSLETLGWNVIRVENGHDLQAVYLAVEKGIEAARNNPSHPVCLWVKTIKGYGVKSTEENASGGHSFPLKNGEKIIEFVNEICGGNPPTEIAAWAAELRRDWEEKQKTKKATTAPAVKKDKVQAGLAEGAIQATKEGYPVFSISSDVQGSTGMAAFQKSFPERFLEVGIAESNMVSVGAGFAKAGFIPIVDTFAQFGVTKGNLPLTMAALSQSPVIAVFSHAGFQDAADGASHQATTYIAALAAIPHTSVVLCSCADQAQSLMHQAIQRYAEARKKGEDGETVVFIIGRENFPVHYAEKISYEWAKPQLLKQGKDVVIAASGPMVGKALEAAELLKEQGVNATVFDHPFVNRPDVKTIGDAVQAAGGRLITTEDHQLIAGMGSILIHALAQKGIHLRARSLGVRGQFGQSAYTANQLYDLHALNANAIVKAAKEIC